MPSLASARFILGAVLPAVPLVDPDDVAGYGVVRARARDARLPSSTWTGTRRARRTWPRRGIFRSWRRWRLLSSEYQRRLF